MMAIAPMQNRTEALTMPSVNSGLDDLSRPFSQSPTRMSRASRPIISPATEPMTILKMTMRGFCVSRAILNPMTSTQRPSP